MKTPRCIKLAEEYCDKRYGFNNHEFDAFLAGYDAADKEWINVNERLPEPGEVIKCLVHVQRDMFDKISSNIALVLWHKNSWTFPLTSTEFYTEKITHWMPLPNLPEDL